LLSIFFATSDFINSKDDNPCKNMNIISVMAHFDGEDVLLDQKLELETDTKLIVTVLPQRDYEREAWMNLSIKKLEDAYGLDEIEYSLDLIKEANPEYEP
jgi:hypothetical protein